MKRVLTAALVVAGVLGFVSAVGNWTKALDAEFLVYGQSPGPVPPPPTTITKILPQIAAGSFDAGANSFTTIIQIINAGTSSVSLTVELFNTDGSASTVPFTTTDQTTPSFTGSVSSLTLPANGSIVLTSGDPSTGTTNWGRVTTDAAVTILSVFEFRTAAGALNARVGVPASVGTMTKLVIPRLRNVDDDVSTAFALVNTGSSSETITGTLYSTSGTVLGSASLSLAAGNHTAQFAREFFGLTNESAGANFSHMIFEAVSAFLAATALVFEGGNQATFPVDQLQ